MFYYIPDRRGKAMGQLMQLEPWQWYPAGSDLRSEFLAQAPPRRLSITRRTPIASIGSCFAREIKKWLQANSFNFVQTAGGKWAESGSARYDRVYNSFSVRQEFERAFGTFSPRETLWEFQEGAETRLLDPYRRTIAWDSYEEMQQELAEHREQVAAAFRSCEVLIVTVGQAEVWYNRSDGAVYPLLPPVQVFDPQRHAFRLTTFEENLANLDRVHELFRQNNPAGHIIVTVSPVPLRATFRPMNSVIANSASKAALRAAVDAFCERHPETVTYFPAYEIVTVTEPDAYTEDNRHVRAETVETIMEVFERWFVDEADAPPAKTPAAAVEGR